MAVNFLNDISKYEFSGFPIGFSRNNPIPLDKTEVWLSFEELQTYAREGATAYVGQKLTHVDVENKTATVYVVANEDGDLMPVGSPTEGDEVSISLNDGVLSLKDFGKFFYRYVAAVGEEGQDGYVAAHYERTEVSAEHPWVAGLEPKVTEVDEVLTLGWYEPNPTTLEGLGSQVTATQEAVDNLETNVGELEEEVLEVADDVKEIQDVLNDTVDADGQTVEGLKTKVTNLEEEVTDLWSAVDNTYTKEEVNNLVSSVFHFKGSAASFEDLPLINEIGDVYQVGDKEYAWNGTEWFELGDMVSLEGYATEDYVNGKVSSLNTAITTLNSTLNEVKTNGETNTSDITALQQSVGSLETNSATKTELQAVAGDIEDLQDLVGTPTTPGSTLFTTVETLQTRVDNLTAEGGEPNIINGITINGTALTPTAQKIVDIPVFNGANYGLIPNPGAGVESNYLLSANGLWVNPIGNLGDFDTVVDYVDNAIEGVRLVWEAIAE